MFPTEGNVIATVRVADKMEEENTRYIRTYEDKQARRSLNRDGEKV